MRPGRAPTGSWSPSLANDAPDAGGDEFYLKLYVDRVVISEENNLTLFLAEANLCQEEMETLLQH